MRYFFNNFFFFLAIKNENNLPNLCDQIYINSYHALRYFWLTQISDCTNYFNIPGDDARLEQMYQLFPLFRKLDADFIELRTEMNQSDIGHVGLSLFAANIMFSTKAIRFNHSLLTTKGDIVDKLTEEVSRKKLDGTMLEIFNLTIRFYRLQNVIFKYFLSFN